MKSVKAFVYVFLCAMGTTHNSLQAQVANVPSPGKQFNTGWTGFRTDVNNKQTQAYNPKNPTAPMVVTPYNYYAFPQQSTKGVRVTNGIPGYGKTQDPYSKGDEKGFYLFAGFGTGSDSGGGITSEIQNGLVAGAYVGSPLGKTTAFSIGAGTYLSGSMRIEAGYSSYSGLKYPSKAMEQPEDPEDEESYEISYDVLGGGGITSNYIGLSFYYSMKDIVGDFLGGLFEPYVGGSMGLSFNTIESYKLDLGDGYASDDACLITYDDYSAVVDSGNEMSTLYCSGYGGGSVEYVGATTIGFAMGFEAGLTMNLQENVSLDFFYRNNRLGEISTSGNVFKAEDQYEVYIYNPTDGGTWNDSIMAMGCDYDDGDTLIDEGLNLCYVYSGVNNESFTERKESGTLNIWEFGIKIRALF